MKSIIFTMIVLSLLVNSKIYSLQQKFRFALVNSNLHRSNSNKVEPKIPASIIIEADSLIDISKLRLFSGYDIKQDSAIENTTKKYNINPGTHSFQIGVKENESIFYHPLTFSRRKYFSGDKFLIKLAHKPKRMKLTIDQAQPYINDTKRSSFTINSEVPELQVFKAGDSLEDNSKLKIPNIYNYDFNIEKDTECKIIFRAFGYSEFDTTLNLQSQKRYYLKILDLRYQDNKTEEADSDSFKNRPNKDITPPNNNYNNAAKRVEQPDKTKLLYKYSTDKLKAKIGSGAFTWSWNKGAPYDLGAVYIGFKLGWTKYTGGYKGGFSFWKIESKNDDLKNYFNLFDFNYEHNELMTIKIGYLSGCEKLSSNNKTVMKIRMFLIGPEITWKFIDVFFGFTRGILDKKVEKPTLANGFIVTAGIHYQLYNKLFASDKGGQDEK